MAVSLAEGVVALERATSDSRGKLDAEVEDGAVRLLAKIQGRRDMSMATTVVVFAGATGSGKSSLFNAVIGEDLARVTPSRPTTSRPLGATGHGKSEFLDWLGVPDRSVLEAPNWISGHDLVLVDLPDIDSTQEGHREVAEGLIARADLIVWVVDPQKYADGVLHLEFLQNLREQSGAMLVVLNQVDTLTPEQAEAVAQHLEALLEGRGVTSAVCTTSARTGMGITPLREYLAHTSATKAAAAVRLAADLRGQAMLFQDAVCDGGGCLDPAMPVPDPAPLVEEVSSVLGVGSVQRAAGQSYFHRGIATTGWVWTRWLRSFRADPLKRLHLGGEASTSSSPPAKVSEQAHGASTVPRSIQHRSLARGAVRRYADEAASSLPVSWRRAVVKDAQDRVDVVIDAADVVFSRMRGKYVLRPAWWSAMRALQWVLGAAALVGLGWLGAYWIGDMLRLHLPELPDWGPIPVPTALLVGGLVLGWLLALLSRLLLARGRDRTQRRVGRALRVAIGESLEETFMRPLVADLAKYSRFSQEVELLAQVVPDGAAISGSSPDSQFAPRH